MRRLWVLTAAMILTAAPLAAAQERADTVMVRGDVLKPGPWGIEDLKRQFAKEARTVTFTPGTDKPEKTGTGIPLLALIQAAGPRVEKVPKHYDLTFFVILEARDGYRVYFSMAELLPQCGDARVWLVWDSNGKPLTEREAPLRLVVSSDHGRDRYIYAIKTVTLVDGNKLAAGLASGK